MKSTWKLVARSSESAPADDRGDRRAGEERQHQAQAAIVAARQEAPAPARSCRRTASRPRPASTAGRRPPGRAQPPGQAGEQQPGVQERALPGRQVVAVADQAVLAGLARPVEVLQRVGDEEAVRARHDAASDPDLQQQAAEHGQRERRERRQRPRLDGIQAADERPHARDSAAPAAGSGGLRPRHAPDRAPAPRAARASPARSRAASTAASLAGRSTGSRSR